MPMFVFLSVVCDSLSLSPNLYIYMFAQLDCDDEVCRIGRHGKVWGKVDNTFV